MIEGTSPTFIGGLDEYRGISVSDKLMMVFGTLANCEAYRILGRRFAFNRGIEFLCNTITQHYFTKGNVHYTVMKTCRALAEIADQFRKWPSLEGCA